MKKKLISGILTLLISFSLYSSIASADEVNTNTEDTILVTGDLSNESINTINEDLSNFQSISTSSLPPNSVDNSQTKYFPAILNQIGGTCVAYSMVYYQATYTINKEKDIASDCDENILSPIFAFNLANGEDDSGTVSSYITSILNNVGCATLDKVPIEENNNPYFFTSWHPTADIWENAMEHRITSNDIYYFNDSYESINYIKSLLANGSVLCFGSDIYKWVTKSLPDSIYNGEYGGEKIVPYCNSSFSGGGHSLTIVGYNDNLWYDINNNGNVDEGEKGAFKIANSWGTSWGNDGFMWLSYDAFFRKSTVADMPEDINREGAANNNFQQIFISTYEEKEPIACIELTMNTSKRKYVEILLEEIDGDVTYKYPISLSYSNSDGGEFSFDGSTENNDGTFIYDISNINSNLKAEDLKNKEFKVVFNETKLDGTALTIKDIKLKDVKNEIDYDILDEPVSIDGDSVTISSKNSIVSTPTNINYTKINNKINLTWDNCTSSNSSIYKYQIYREHILIGESKTNSYTDEYPSDGDVTYYIKAIDKNNSYSLKGERTVSNNQLTVYYKSKYPKANIHYCIGNGKWTSVPGIEMKKSTVIDEYFEYNINLDDYDETTNVKLCFNNGNNKWDNNNSKNYSLSKGIYIIEDGVVTEKESAIKINKISLSNNPSGTANLFTDISNTNSIGQVFYTITYLSDSITYSASLGGDSTTLTTWTPLYEGEYKIDAYIIINDSSVLFTQNVTYKADENFEMTDYYVDKESPVNIGDTLHLYTNTNEEDVLYRFSILKDGKNVFARSYNNNNSTTWVPTEAGIYTIYFKAKNINGIEKTNTLTYIVEENSFIKINNVTTNLSSNFNLGDSITLSTFANSNTSINYRFVVLKNNKNIYTRGYNSKYYASWTPKELGRYTIYYFAKDKLGNIVSKTKEITIN